MHYEITEAELRIRAAAAGDILFIQSLAERLARFISVLGMSKKRSS